MLHIFVLLNPGLCLPIFAAAACWRHNFLGNQFRLSDCFVSRFVYFNFLTPLLLHRVSDSTWRKICGASYRMWPFHEYLINWFILFANRLWFKRWAEVGSSSIVSGLDGAFACERSSNTSQRLTGGILISGAINLKLWCFWRFLLLQGVVWCGFLRILVWECDF